MGAIRPAQAKSHSQPPHLIRIAVVGQQYDMAAATTGLAGKTEQRHPGRDKIPLHRPGTDLPAPPLNQGPCAIRPPLHSRNCVSVGQHGMQRPGSDPVPEQWYRQYPTERVLQCAIDYCCQRAQMSRTEEQTQ